MRIAALSSFGESCYFKDGTSFGEGCSFGDSCDFGNCKIENGKEFVDFLKFEGFGSSKRCTYIFKLVDHNIYVRCGCFAGYIDEFRAKVRSTHKDSKYAKEYLLIADLAESHFKE